MWPARLTPSDGAGVNRKNRNNPQGFCDEIASNPTNPKTMKTKTNLAI
jgi:hypothetical protein